MSTNIADYVRTTLVRRGRWGISEIAFWLIAAATLYFLPERHLILNEIAIIGLFALSLDLILGYAGIVSLGHAAFFGLGAYAAGILARDGIADPLLGLGAAAIAAAILGFVTSFLVLRGSDLTKLMVTLGVALVLGEIANQASWLTGGADGLQGIAMGPILGLFEFDIFGTTAYAYSLTVTFLLFIIARRIVVSPYGLSLRSIRDNPLKARAVGIPVNRRLVAIYTLAAAYAGVAGALLAQTTQFVSLDVLAFHRSADVMLVLVIGGVGYLYGGLIGAIVFKVLQDVISAWTPQYWQFWIGLILVIIVLAGREHLTERVRTFWKGMAGRSAKIPETLPKPSAREV
ncbi:branched-chain amino acid ABC transporter permease [Microvirga terrestris]|uniref:Branched-chain amino acid ABC transporter permease n=1 Tax=Microvirga terrestris TaxID=2791024 RepID=A0ABS0HQM6_9HYPH|nr:branched-chain amino acid ABC transporter permease [Microvirga terrestris]MBF9195787.1 branched-chain amino acid ABC transporter permease [Microvirga terrestris]